MKVRYCPLCNSINVQERYDRPSGINVGGVWYLCRNCGHKSLSMPLRKVEPGDKRALKKSLKKTTLLYTSSESKKRNIIKEELVETTGYTETNQLQILIVATIVVALFTIYDSTYWPTVVFPVLIALNIIYQKYSKK